MQVIADISYRSYMSYRNLHPLRSILNPITSPIRILHSEIRVLVITVIIVITVLIQYFILSTKLGHFLGIFLGIQFADQETISHVLKVVEVGVFITSKL